MKSFLKLIGNDSGPNFLLKIEATDPFRKVITHPSLFHPYAIQHHVAGDGAGCSSSNRRRLFLGARGGGPDIISLHPGGREMIPGSWVRLWCSGTLASTVVPGDIICTGPIRGGLPGPSAVPAGSVSSIRSVSPFPSVTSLPSALSKVTLVSPVPPPRALGTPRALHKTDGPPAKKNPRRT